jgi:DNA repair protein RecN (Recombination protein N)
MITHLKIRNFILIRSLDIDFRQGFSVITGETGAGKSILLGALGLILGERAESRQLFNEKEKCVIEGTFDISDYNLQDYFESRNLDYDEHTIIRREISESGKSRAFINDTPVTLSDLKELGGLLVDIHSQHETLQLNSAAYHSGLVDSYCGNRDLLQAYQEHYRNYKLLGMELQSLLEQEFQLKKDLDYFQFQHNELTDAGLNEEEYERMQQEIDTLNHAEEIKNSTSAAAALLSEQEINILDQLNEVKSLISGIARIHAPVQELFTRLQSAGIELKDIAGDLQHIADSTYADAEKINLYNQKLQNIFNLQKKHQVKTVGELISIREELDHRINSITGFDDRIASLRESISQVHALLIGDARKLSKKRMEAMPKILEVLGVLMQHTGLVNAQVGFEHMVNEDQPGENGIDKIQLMFTGNKGTSLQPIHKAASGGELSRLMLCIKYIMAKTKALPTLIFDEIDTGISGEVALKVGAMMQEMSGRHQLFAITHLPQIAGKGEHHYFVYKQLQNDITISHIRELTSTERETEIAKMIGGEKPSEKALANAKELLGKA